MYHDKTMKPTLALRSFLLGSISLAVSPLIHAGNTWDGGGANDNTNTAANWDANTLPGANPALLFTGSARTSPIWNGRTVAGTEMNVASMTFNTSGFTLINGTLSAIQFVGTGGSTAGGNLTFIQNNASALLTIQPQSRFFYKGIRTVDAGTGGIALNGGLLFRAESLGVSDTITMNLTGTATNSTVSSISMETSQTFSSTQTALTKNGSGKWTVTGGVSLSGATTITAGTLEFQGSISSSTIANNAAMILNNANATSFSYANNITGTGTVTKSGLGTFTLNGASNSYSGATSVDGGKLVVNGNITTSITTVNTGGTLGGSGTVGALTINSGGFHTPGNSPGIQNTGNYSNAGTLGIEIDGATVGTGYDQVNVTGTVTLSGLLSVTMGYTPAANALFFILANDLSDPIVGTFSNASVDGSIYNLGGQDFRISYFGNQTSPGVGTFTGGNDVVLTAIPEPSAALLGGLGMLMLLRRRRD